MEDDIFSELFKINAKQTYPKPFKKLIRPITNAKNVRKVYKPVEKVPELVEKCEPLNTKIAVEYLLNGKLKSTVCRYCLTISPGLSELDQIMNIAGTGTMYKVTIREMIACFYPVKVSHDQNFPDKICQKCLDKTLSAYLFTQQLEQSERALLNCFDDLYEKLGKLDPIDRPKKRGRQKLNPNYNTLYVEHEKVIDYAEPIRNIINVATESLTTEPDWNDYECKKCWQVLPNMESLLNHEKIHPKHMWYHCRLCGKSFLKHNQLKKHHTRVHELEQDKPRLQANQSFKCNNCGHVTENYIQHLEHIEKHKFKDVMKHIIEKKTDKLCTVCLNKSPKLVELDDMVCIHGGSPELMGDKTLHTVLASTLPNQKSYKYQELHVPHKAKIMTISKKKRKGNNVQDDMKTKFILSLPSIISIRPFKTNDFYYYVFCDPRADNYSISTNDNNDTLDAAKPKILEITDNLILTDDKEQINNGVYNLENDDTIMKCNLGNAVRKNETDDKQPQTEFMAHGFTFPELVVDQNNTLESDIAYICKYLKPNYGDGNVMINKALDIDKKSALYKPKLSKDCGNCWIFKNVDKCESCKKSIKNKDIVSKDIVFMNTNREAKSYKNEAENVGGKTMKFDAGHKRTTILIGRTKDNKNTDKPDVVNITSKNHYCFPLETIEDKTVMDGVDSQNSNKSVNTSNNISTTQDMDVETDTVENNYEEMDIEESPVENVSTSDIVTSTQINTLTAFIWPHIGTNYQFNMGSSADHGKGHRKSKKALRNRPKAFHK